MCLHRQMEMYVLCWTLHYLIMMKVTPGTFRPGTKIQNEWSNVSRPKGRRQWAKRVLREGIFAGVLCGSGCTQIFVELWMSPGSFVIDDVFVS